MANVEIIVDAVVDGALSGLRAVEDAMSGLQPAAKAIQGVGKVAFAALAAGAAAGAAALVDVTKAAMEAEEIAAKFDSIVASSHLADYSAEMKKLATTLSQTTRFEDEAILAAETKLALYENIGKDIFPQVIATSLDLAEALGVDAASGAETLGRALADIEGGSLSMLRRSRLLTDEQVKQAEAMAETGDLAAAQAFILDILEGKVGNLAEAMGDTFAGKMEKLKNSVGNLREALGDQLLPVLGPVIDRFIAIVDVYGPKLVSWFQDEIVPVVKGAVSVFQDFLSVLTGGKDFDVDTWLADIDWAGISENIIAGIDSIDWNAVGLQLNYWLGVVFETLKSAASEMDWQGIFSSLGNAFMEFSTGLGGGSTEQFISVWRGNFQQIATMFDSIGRIIADSAARAVVTWQNNFMQLGQIILQLFVKFIPLMAILSRRVINSVASVFKAGLEKFREVGQGILNGLQAGIEEGWASFTTWLTAKIMQVVETVMNALGIHSPSRVFANIGKMMMAGMAEGIGNGVTMPIQTMQTAMPQVLAPAMSAAQATQNHYYYGARILLERGNEGQILASLTV